MWRPPERRIRKPGLSVRGNTREFRDWHSWRGLTGSGGASCKTGAARSTPNTNPATDRRGCKTITPAATPSQLIEAIATQPIIRLTELTFSRPTVHHRAGAEQQTANVAPKRNSRDAVSNNTTYNREHSALNTQQTTDRSRPASDPSNAPRGLSPTRALHTCRFLGQANARAPGKHG